MVPMLQIVYDLHRQEHITDLARCQAAAEVHSFAFVIARARKTMHHYLDPLGHGVCIERLDGQRRPADLVKCAERRLGGRGQT